jgi:hypothetical protein
MVDTRPYDGPVGATEILAPHRAAIGTDTYVTRYLPTRPRRTVGAWCFLDCYGPNDVADRAGMRVGPHPHTGIQTVTWLLAGDVVHRDSLGSVQEIRPGQLNIMTAGAGISHAEESPTPHPRWLHGVQLWVALRDVHRHAAPAFGHHPVLPEADLGGARATVFVGELAGARSPATVHSPLLGADVVVPTAVPSSIPLEPGFEHALLVVDGTVLVDERRLVAGDCAYMGRSRAGLRVAGAPSGRFLLVGGEPFDESLVMWWNFVGRSAEEIIEVRLAWEDGRGFGEVVGAAADRVPAPALPAGRLRPRPPTGG